MKKAMLLTWGMYKRKEFHLGEIHDIYGTIVSAGMGGRRKDQMADTGRWN